MGIEDNIGSSILAMTVGKNYNIGEDVPITKELKLLMAAVLREAKKDLKKKPKTLEYKSAYKWLYDTDNDDYVFSFHTICEVLNIDMEYAERKLLDGRY